MGYAIAQDRLFQIEAFRRATTGTLAEIIGRSALEDDIVARRDYYTRGRARGDDREPAGRPAIALAGVRGRRERLDRRGELGSRARCRPSSSALGAAPEPLQVHEMAAIGIFLARTTPSDDGEELANLEGFQAVGAKTFNRVFPLRTPGQFGTVPRRHGLFPSRPGTTRKSERRAFKRSSAYAKRPAAARGGGLRVGLAGARPVLPLPRRVEDVGDAQARPRLAPDRAAARLRDARAPRRDRAPLPHASTCAARPRPARR